MSYLFANQRGQIWRNKVHLGTQIAVQHLTKFRQGNNTTGKLLDVDQINWRYIHPCTYVNASHDNSFAVGMECRIQFRTLPISSIHNLIPSHVLSIRQQCGKAVMAVSDSRPLAGLLLQKAV